MSILVSIRSLLNYPNPNSPANNEACKTYINNLHEYERQVREIVNLSQAEEMEEEWSYNLLITFLILLLTLYTIKSYD